MKKVKINSKVLFLLWVVLFIIARVVCDGLIEQKTRMVPIGNTYMEIATPERALLISVLTVFLFLPLAILTYRTSKETNKRIHFISGFIVFWLSISLLACVFILLFG